MSLRKSSRSKNGSKSLVLSKPNARRRCTPAPSIVGLDLIIRFTGRIDILASRAEEIARSQSWRYTSPRLACLLRGQAVDFGDEAAGKFHDRAGPIGKFVRRRQYLRAGSRGFCKRGAEVLHLVSRDLAAERIRQVAVGHKNLHVAECRSDSHTAIGF